ncbi:FeoB-associated Cys-rich membrane protein [Cyclobacterium sp. GBPx2]|uniref:FeoB-associated Cys-rich membrane protein n=1 Tax=Cyclobacterium plantarum TaxID=2716263 RepID=A0ABX0HCE9_9BACT|nr:FeoB-associated Cys-rich membrane protein [Cyclobacterium sp.]NHE59564.1 FeoB-associated Cys-rich membrane protein [Cyclobacterium plantarum]
MWQEIIVGILFTGVIFFWIYRTWIKKRVKGQNGCGCDKCG